MSWVLGRLDEHFGKDAFNVHLARAPDATAASFARRGDFGIMQAYRDGVLLHADPQLAPLDLARDYLQTVESNIRLFLRDKPRQMQAHLETGKQDFERFWEQIGARGDLPAALQEFDTRYNRS